MKQIRKPFILVKDNRNDSWSLLLTCRIAGSFNLYGMDMLTMALISPVAVNWFTYLSNSDMFFVFDTEMFCLHDCRFVSATYGVNWNPGGDIATYTYEFSYPRGSHVHESDPMFNTVIDTCNLLLKIQEVVG